MKKKVCIQGLGFVGAAMAAAVANAKNSKGEYYFDVKVIDLKTASSLKKINLANSGQFPMKTCDKKLKKVFKSCIKRGNLEASSNEKFYENADIIIVDIGIDIDFYSAVPKINFNNFKSAIQIIAKKMKSNALVIIETTVPPGTCEKIVLPIIVKEFKKKKIDFTKINLAHSYERVMPGKNYYDSIVNFWRVYSAINENSAKKCQKFLEKVINTSKYPLTRLNSTTASETAKLLENSYRAVNIAFIHEWTAFAELSGIDLFEIINAIKIRPTHKNIRFPGLGIGGYCLTKDPSFAPAVSKSLFGTDLDFPFSKLSTKVSMEMPLYTFKRAKKMLGQFQNKKILLCGISYRQDIADTRYSPTQILYEKLLTTKAKVDLHDPMVTHWNEFSLDINASVFPSSETYDLVIFCVPHSFYCSLNLSNWIKNKKKTKVLDAFMVFKSNERIKYLKKGVQIEAIGVAKGI
jgi:UDP-N-acetyl-D-glucosamine dehydrogenase